MMSSTPLIPQDWTSDLPMGPNRAPKIKVIFRGFIITRIRHGEYRAMIGALAPTVRDAACHKPIIHIFEIDGNGVTTERRDLNFGLEENFYLTVGDPPRVQIFQKDGDPFNQLDEIDNDKKDFRWFVDLNKIHQRPDTNRVEINESKLKPKFFLDRGVFHASKLSDGEVKIWRPFNPSSRPKRFGRFAMEITARIELTSSEEALFKYGSNPLLRIRGDQPLRYEIVFDCTCRSRYEYESDFGHVYDVITNQGGSPIDPWEWIRLDSPVYVLLTEEELNVLRAQKANLTYSARKTPEVYCIGGNG